MPQLGPTLPPHLAKRSRSDDEDSDSASEKRQRVAGPAPPPKTSPISGPSLPPRAAIAGPTPPPAPLNQRPQQPPSDSESDSSDDDFGPAPPPAGATYDDDEQPTKSAFDTEPTYTETAPKKAQRDDWMTMPPTQDDLAARLDPTKQRARKFNTGKSANAAAGGMSSAWTETPEQKLKRLQDEAMGISAPANSAAPSHESRRTKDEERRQRKMREKIDAARGKSLVEQHAEKGAGKEKEDDPSKRAFDYEKDMAVIGTANHKQRREIVKESKGFGDRFSSGRFL